MHESFCEADLEKPSLEAGHSFTISLMLACNECPCVCLNLAVLNSVFVTPLGLRLDRNSIILWFRPAVCACVLLCELV